MVCRKDKGITLETKLRIVSVQILRLKMVEFFGLQQVGMSNG